MLLASCIKVHPASVLLLPQPEFLLKWTLLPEACPGGLEFSGLELQRQSLGKKIPAIHASSDQYPCSRRVIPKLPFCLFLLTITKSDTGWAMLLNSEPLCRNPVVVFLSLSLFKTSSQTTPPFLSFTPLVQTVLLGSLSLGVWLQCPCPSGSLRKWTCRTGEEKKSWALARKITLRCSVYAIDWKQDLHVACSVFGEELWESYL